MKSEKAVWIQTVFLWTVLCLLFFGLWFLPELQILWWGHVVLKVILIVTTILFALGTIVIVGLIGWDFLNRHNQPEFSDIWEITGRDTVDHKTYLLFVRNSEGDLRSFKTREVLSVIPQVGERIEVRYYVGKRTKRIHCTYVNFLDQNNEGEVSDPFKPAP